MEQQKQEEDVDVEYQSYFTGLYERIIGEIDFIDFVYTINLLVWEYMYISALYPAGAPHDNSRKEWPNGIINNKRLSWMMTLQYK